MTEGVELGKIGPCHGVAKAYLSSLPTGRRVLIIPVAFGNTGLTAKSLNPFWFPTSSTARSTVGYLFTNAITQSNLAIAAAKAQFTDSSLDFIVWVQGENDNQKPDYAETLDTLLKEWRARITGAASAPFIVGSMNPYAIAHLYDGEIDLIHKDTPRRDLLTAFAQRGDNLVSGAPLSPDLYCSPDSTCASAGAGHFSGPGQRLQALSIFQALAHARANILGALPGAPTQLTAAVVLATSVHLQWNSPLSRITRSIVQYQVRGATGWTNFATPPAQFNDLAPLSDVNVTGLSPSTAYNFRVAAVNESGAGPYSAVASATTSTTVLRITNPVVGVTANQLANGVVTVSWLPPFAGDSPSGFSVRYRPSGAGTFTIATVTSSPYTIPGALDRGTSYELEVAPVDSAGIGPYSIRVQLAVE